MAFQPRNFEQILTDMIAHVRANTTLTDFTVGSVIRTILEAAALEDDEQYFQMVQLLDAFRIQTARNADLDERAADYNLVRLPSKSSFTDSIVIQNGNLVTDTLVFDVVSGSPQTLKLGDTTDFPAAPFTIRVGEGTPQVEDCTVTLNNTTTNELTVSALVNDHSVGDRVSVTGGGDKVISAGQQIQVPAQGNDSPIVFTTIDVATIIDGNYESGRVSGSANVPGRNGNVAAGRISQFQGSPPFVGALVTNKSSTEGGRDLETDSDFRARILRRLAELMRGTVYAIESGVIGVENPLTGQSVATSKLREDFNDPYNHILYVDDGTGFSPTQVNMAQSTLNGLHGIGLTVLTVNSNSDFPDAGEILLEPEGANPEHLTYSSKGAGNILNLDSPTVYSHPSGSEVLLVDNLGTAEEGQNFFQLSDYPLVKNTLELYDNDTGVFELKSEGTDFVINRTNGEIEYLGSGLASGTTPLARYSHYTGLIQEVQKVVTGDPNDRVNYPGIVAGGIIVHVSTPTIRRITVTAAVTARTGFDESTLRDEVQREIEAYIESLKIGDNVYRAKIIERAMRVTGIENIIIQEPTSDLVILENELPVPSDINGNSLVTVL